MPPGPRPGLARSPPQLCRHPPIFSSSLAAAAFIAGTLDLGTWKKMDFNGLMLPVLQDSILARCSIDGTLTLRDLLLFSAVRGACLGTVPLPANTSLDQHYAVPLHVAAKKAGDHAAFDFSFFSNVSILDLPVFPLSGPLFNSAETFTLHPQFQTGLNSRPLMSTRNISRISL